MNYHITFNGQTAAIQAPMPLTEGSFVTLGEETILIERVRGNRVVGTKVKFKPIKVV